MITLTNKQKHDVILHLMDQHYIDEYEKGDAFLSIISDEFCNQLVNDCLYEYS